MKIMKIDTQLDEDDQKILKILMQDARKKNTEIAREIGLTEGAIRKRIKRLVENRIIEGFTIKLSERMFGYRAVVSLKIGGNIKPTDIRSRILEHIPNGVELIYEVTGDIDLFVILHVEAEIFLKEAIEKIRDIPGVNEARTYVILTKHAMKTEFN
jgi:DNA-binding Lrp family transcriptional regulator